MIDIATYINPEKSQWEVLTRRCQRDEREIQQIVERILCEVRTGGDKALKEICRRIDGDIPDNLKLTGAQREEIASGVPQQVKKAIQRAKENIEVFHRAQLPHEVRVETCDGVTCIQRAVPINRVGIYIPGGKAPLFSTVLMLAIPAKIAGCKEVVMCTPLGKDGKISAETIFAANVCGVDSIYTVGGAQAIAAMAYGTESIPKVNKIFGPGNRYVTAAKQRVSSDTVAIDMPAGPSEVMVLADATCQPAFVTADMLSQAEHGDDSQAILVCDSTEIAQAVKKEIVKQLKNLRRGDTAAKSLANSRIIVFNKGNMRKKMAEFADYYAPEHLIISTRDPWEIADSITAAGSIFIGNFSPESAGDYASGTNHTLPTSGWATACSGVNIDSYMRKITYQQLSAQGLENLSETIVTMARAEGLDAHANAVTTRLKGGKA